MRRNLIISICLGILLILSGIPSVWNVPLSFAQARGGPHFRISPSSQNYTFTFPLDDVLYMKLNVTNTGNQTGSYVVEFNPDLSTIANGNAQIWYETTVSPGGTVAYWIDDSLILNFPNLYGQVLHYTAKANVYALDVNGQKLSSTPDDTATINITVTILNPVYQVVTGHVTDALTGRPIQGARVVFSLYQSNRDAPGAPGNPLARATPAYSASDGSYSENVYATLPLVVTVQAAGYAGFYQENYKVPGNATKDFKLYPNNVYGNYAIKWQVLTSYPIYVGATSSDFRYIAVAGGEHPTQGFASPPVANFTSKYSIFIYLYDINGTLLWKYGPLTGALAQPGIAHGSLEGGVWAMDVTGDGSLVAAGTTDGRLLVFNRRGLLWNVSMYAQLGDQGACSTCLYSVRGVRFSPDGKYLAAETRTDTGLFDSQTGKLLWHIPSTGNSPPRDFLFSADGRYLLSGSTALRLITINGTVVWSKPLDSFPFGFSSTGNFSVIASGGKGGHLMVFDASGNLKFIAEETVIVNWATVSSDGTLIASGNRGYLDLFSGGGKLLWQQRIGDTSGGMMTDDGKYILAGTWGQQTIYPPLDNNPPPPLDYPNGLILFDRNGSLIWNDYWNSTATKWQPPQLAQAKFAVISSDLKYIVSGSTDNYLRVYQGGIISKDVILPLSVTADGNRFSMGVSTNSTLLAYSFGAQNKSLSFRVSGLPHTQGYLVAKFLKSMLGGNLTVSVDGTQVPFKLGGNSTHYFVSVNYPHSQHSLVITGTTTSTTSTTSSTASTTSAPASTTASTTSAPASTTASTSASTSGGGGIPEFPFQILVVTILTVVVLASYLVVRRRTSHGPGNGQSAAKGRASWYSRPIDKVFYGVTFNNASGLFGKNK